MSKYTQADDGKTIGGKIVVWIQPPAAEAESSSGESAQKLGTTKGPGPDTSAMPVAPAAPPKRPELAKKAPPAVAAKMAAGQARALKKAAEDGKPFCEHCEAARRQLAAMKGA